ncbi:MAG: hypothetical protein F6K62_23455, partial [Sphaerospermopsis sp. SIO1G2]|nr:hypothetical protein [Sphaerospermopsis sp. SIO1G2]
VEICETLLRYDEYWNAAANEGDVFWKEEEAGDYFDACYSFIPAIFIYIIL